MVPLAPPTRRSASLACVSWSTSTPDRASRDAEVPNVRRKVDKRGVGGGRAPLPPPSLPPPPPAPIAAHRASEANRADPAPRLGSGAPRVELRSDTLFGLLFLDVDNNNSSGRKLVTHAR